MPSPKVKAGIMALFAGALAFASVHGEEENKAEGAAKGPEMSRDEKEFNEKTARLNSLTTRLEEDERHFMELVRTKAEEKSSQEKQRIIHEMVEITNDRNKSADEFNKLKSELSLRFPNRGQHLDRRYQTQPKKTVEEMEGAAGLDELLTRTKKIIEKKYAPFRSDKEPLPKPKPEITESESGETKRLRLEK